MQIDSFSEQSFMLNAVSTMRLADLPQVIQFCKRVIACPRKSSAWQSES